MTTNKKEIKINPALFKISSSKKDKTKKAKPVNFKPMSIKRDLIKRIRERKNLANNNEDSFKTSMNLFKEIDVKKKEESFDKPKIETPNVKPEEKMDISVKTDYIENYDSNSGLLPQPPYSNLKNNTSHKPTYREWKTTTQKRPHPVVLTEPMKEKKHVAKKSKHYTKLGKKNKTISVLIKDRATRKTVDQEVNLLKHHEISKIKEYLRDRGLIKIGSHAPESILRETYENAFLTGDVNNVSKENLIHNYLNS